MRSEIVRRNVERDNATQCIVSVYVERIQSLASPYFIHRFRDQFKIDFPPGKILFRSVTIFFLYSIFC